MTAVEERVTARCPYWCADQDDAEHLAETAGNRCCSSAPQIVETYPGGPSFNVTHAQGDCESSPTISVDGGGYFDPHQIHDLVKALYALRKVSLTQELHRNTGRPHPGTVRATRAHAESTGRRSRRVSSMGV